MNTLEIVVLVILVIILIFTIILGIKVVFTNPPDNDEHIYEENKEK